MRLVTSILLFLIGGFSFSACHYAQVKDEEEKTIAVSEFDKIYVKGSFTILLEQDDQPGINIRGLKETLNTVDA